MSRYSVISVAALAFVWMILVEEFSWITLGTGVAIGIGCVLFLGKFLPSKKSSDVKFLKLAAFPFWLIWKVYLSGIIYVAKFVFKGTKDQVGAVTVETKLKSELLRIILIDADTLTPGTVIIKLQDNAVTILWIGEEKDALNEVNYIESKLLESQK